jgi:hypothetical protein
VSATGSMTPPPPSPSPCPVGEPRRSTGIGPALVGQIRYIWMGLAEAASIEAALLRKGD